MLIAAIDPAAEARLDGFNHALTSGRYLSEKAGDGRTRSGQPTFPLLAASSSGIGEYAVTQVQRLPALILVVCVLFVANSANAAVRGRRRELGVLASLGWTRPRLFAAVLGELAAIGLVAGVLGAVAALLLSSGLGLHASPGRAALAVPVALAVAVVAGLVPAWLAARADPVASVRPPGQLPSRLILAAIAAAGAGVLVTAGAALLPAQMLRRRPAAYLLAEE
jgi:hypothetical protein